MPESRDIIRRLRRLCDGGRSATIDLHADGGCVVYIWSVPAADGTHEKLASAKGRHLSGVVSKLEEIVEPEATHAGA